MSYDLLIKNGTIYDGTGNPGCRGSIGIQGDRMVSDLPGGNPRLVQRAPGFHYTIVNGQVLIKNGEHQGSYPGRALRSV